jgi:hypothetical protein
VREPEKCEFVRDKKMLWRANLYIDEGGLGDWNNVHGWNDPVNNEWFVSKTNGADVDGGQINIAEWSSIRQGGDVSGSVAYSLPESTSSAYHMDTPTQFNIKMQQAKSLLQSWYADPAHPPLAGFTSQALGSWNRTIAPGSNWNNYLRQAFQNIQPRLPGLGLIQSSTGRVEAQAAIAEILGGNAALSAEWAARSAGTDCIGFAQNAASYNGNTYTWPNLPAGGRAYPRTAQDAQASGKTQYGHLIIDKNGYEANGKTLSGMPIVPGDIMYYGNADHIAIVQSVEYTGELLNLGNIRLIEAIAYHSDNPETRYRHVISEQTLSRVHNLGRQWRLVRLEH